MGPTTRTIIISIIAFILGLFIAGAGSSLSHAEKPLGNSMDVPSPTDTITDENIRVYKNGAKITLEDGDDEWLVILDLKNPSWSSFMDTNSMDPVLDKGANGIRIKTKCPESIEVGDIISYKHPTEGIIIHRVVYKDKDEQGTYFILKGDNNPTNDPGKVRCDQYLGKLVGILY